MTIYELIKSCNRKEVFNSFFDRLPDRNKNRFKYKFGKNKGKYNMNKYCKCMNQVLDDMLKLKPTKEDDYIFCYMTYDFDEEPYLCVSIAKVDNIVENKTLVDTLSSKFDLDLYKEDGLKIQSYSLMFISRESLLGHNFCENSLSLFKESDILAAILFELTFFGYRNKKFNKNMKKEIKKLDKSIDEYEKGKFVDLDDFLEKEEINLEDDEFKYIPPTEEELNENILKNMVPIYNEYKWILDKEIEFI